MKNNVIMFKPTRQRRKINKNKCCMSVLYNVQCSYIQNTNLNKLFNQPERKGN